MNYYGSDYKLYQFLNVGEDIFGRPGESSIQKLYEHNIIKSTFLKKEDIYSEDQDICDFLFPPLRENVSPVIGIKNSEGTVKFPVLNPNDPNTCQICIDTGNWGLQYNDNEDIEAELICLRGCQGCVERNNWTWGLFQVKDHLGEYSENIPIPSNGSHINSTRVSNWEQSNGDVIEIILKELLDRYSETYQPCWEYFFDRSPMRIHKIIFEIYRFRKGNIYTVGDQLIPINAFDTLIDVINRRYDIHSDNLILQRREQTEEELQAELEEIFEDYSQPLDTEDTDSEIVSDLTKENVRSMFSILEDIMETDSQKIDQGKYLELCKILKDIHQ